MYEETEYLTVEQIAKQLQVNKRTVLTWITSGELPAVVIGKRGYRVSRTDLHEFLEARKRRKPTNE
jgi:excisionase family DNA binding protein